MSAEREFDKISPEEPLRKMIAQKHQAIEILRVKVQVSTSFEKRKAELKLARERSQLEQLERALSASPKKQP
jgi:hypothetical protein